MDADLADKLSKRVNVFKSRFEVGALKPARALRLAAAD